MDEFNNNPQNKEENENLGGYTITPNGEFFSEEPIPNQNKPQDTVVEAVILDETPINSVKPTENNDIDAAFVNNTTPNNFVPKRKNKKSFSVATVVLSVVLSILAGAGSAFGVFYALNINEKENNAGTNSQVESTPITNTTIVVDKTASNIIEAVTEKSGPSVVGISTTAAVTNFFGGVSDATDEGSGIIYSTDGYIITNYHVIEGAVESRNSSISVYLSSDPDEAISASVIGYNIASDLAVVKINKTGLPAIALGDSDKLKVGQYAVAIGSPGGMEFMNSVSYGIISGLNRSLSTGTGESMTLIQTDAAINPGNSGGALLDGEGNLIGVNSAKLVDTSFEGMGFAIPVNTVKEICDKIIAKQNDPSPYVGIEINQQYTAEILKRLGYPEGAVVNRVIAGGPAEESGLMRGDIITEFNGKTISSYTDLENAISSCNAGDSVTIKIYRSGRFYSTTVRIASNNAQ